MSEHSQAVTYNVDGDVALIHFDDGKANALSMSAIDAIDAALTRAERETKAVVLAGRPGRFCAGFDLSVMNAGIEACRTLVRRGGELALRLYMFPQPVVIACTGHALAAGGVLLTAADHRVGATGEFKIGFNEVAIGLPLPIFLAELAEQRLSRRYLTAATFLAAGFCAGRGGRRRLSRRVGRPRDGGGHSGRAGPQLRRHVEPASVRGVSSTTSRPVRGAHRRHDVH